MRVFRLIYDTINSKFIIKVMQKRYTEYIIYRLWFKHTLLHQKS